MAMLTLNQRGGRKLVRVIKGAQGDILVPPIDDIEAGIARGLRPWQAIREWWSRRPPAERVAAESQGYYTGDA